MRVLGIWSVGVVACLVAQVSHGQGVPYQYWSLNSLGGATNIIISTNLTADIGDGTLTIDPGGRTLLSSAGTLDNALPGYGPGTALEFDGKFGTTAYPSFTVQFSLQAGFTDYRLSYAINPDRTVLNTWQYSLDGAAYADLVTVSFDVTGWQVQTIDLSVIPGLASATTISLRDTFSAGNQGLRNFAIDNIQIQAVPEPPPWAIGLIGLLLLGLRTGHRRPPVKRAGRF